VSIPGRGPGAARTSPARGAALVAVAVILGIVGLQILDDSRTVHSSAAVATSLAPSTLPSATTRPGTTATTRAGTTTTTRAAATTTRPVATTTTTGVRKASQVRVYVYNASGVQGAANNMSNTLKSKGYNTIGTGNLATQKGINVECRTGFDKEAAALAAAVGNAAKVVAFPTNPPAGSTDADCLVVLGQTA